MRPNGKHRLYSNIPVPCNATMRTFSKKKPGTDSVKTLEDRWQHLAFLSITATLMYLAGLVEITRQQHWGLLTWKCVFTKERTVASLNSSFPSRIVVISTYTSLWDWIALGVIVVRVNRLHLHYNGDWAIRDTKPIFHLKFAAPEDFFRVTFLGLLNLCGDFNFFWKRKR